MPTILLAKSVIVPFRSWLLGLVYTCSRRRQQNGLFFFRLPECVTFCVLLHIKKNPLKVGNDNSQEKGLVLAYSLLCWFLLKGNFALLCFRGALKDIVPTCSWKWHSPFCNFNTFSISSCWFCKGMDFTSFVHLIPRDEQFSNCQCPQNIHTGLVWTGEGSWNRQAD